MTPLEKMAYAHCRARSTPDGDRLLGACEPDGDCICVSYMRAAMLELVECELPAAAIDAGLAAAWPSGEAIYDDAHKGASEQTQALFKAICLTLVSQEEIHE